VMFTPLVLYAIVFFHQGRIFDLSEKFEIEGVDTAFLIFKLGGPSSDNSFRISARLDFSTHKLEYEWQNLFGVGLRNKPKCEMERLDEDRQLCRVTSKLASGFYGIFDGKDFYAFEYVKEKSR